MSSLASRFGLRGLGMVASCGVMVAALSACQPDSTPQPGSSSSAPAAQPSDGGGSPGGGSAPVKGLMDITQVPLYQHYKWQWSPMGGDVYARLLSACDSSQDEGFGQIWMEGKAQGATLKATTGVSDPSQVGKQEWTGQEIVLTPKDDNGRGALKQYLLDKAIGFLQSCKGSGTQVTFYAKGDDSGVGGYAAKIVVRKAVGDMVLHDYFVVQSNGVAAELALWESPLHTTSGAVSWPAMDERSIEMVLAAGLGEAYPE